MIQPNADKKFIFNEKINADSLYSLYEDDYQYIEEIFGTTLQHFDADFKSLQQAYESGDTISLKKAVHKIKPTFGFVGMPGLQEICQNFEDICQKAATTDELEAQYLQIVTTLAAGKELIADQYNKLKEYNAGSL
jgi:HPt (histidine-containing phosphotransfer) domain-containing protein